MPRIQKPALQTMYDKLTRSPGQRLDLDELVSIVGDKKVLGFTTTTSAAVARTLERGNLSAAEKLELAKAGLDEGEKADLRELLNDDAFKKTLDPAATNFLRALLGLEALAHTPSGGPASGGAADVHKAPEIVADKNAPEVIAATKLRELIKSGDLQKYYDASIGAVDDPALKAEAEALFKQLPVVKPGMAATDFVKAGLWAKAPQGIEEMQKSARYLPGRQVLVETTCYAKVPARSDVTYETQRKKIGSYDPNGKLAVTYRATLVGADPNNDKNFLVKVDGSDKPISVTKASIFEHNQPHELGKEYIKSDTHRELPYNWTTWDMDYASPLARAKLCEVAIKMDELVGKLDFSKQKTEGGSGINVFGRGDVAQKMVDLQKKCVETVFRSINMKYPREDGRPFDDPGRAPQGNRDVARQAIKGTGMCVQQSTVFGGLMTPFMEVLGVDGQYRSGNCYRNIRGATDNVYAPDYASGHGWWQITFRPSMDMTVTDRTWNQVNLDLDRAYGFPYGDRYANKNITGFHPKKPSATDVNVTGDVTVETVERQFSHAGDGRENHISHSQDP